MTATDIRTGDRVTIREGLPYTAAMQGQVFTVTRVFPRYTYNVEIANEVTGRSGLRFRAEDLEPVARCMAQHDSGDRCVLDDDHDGSHDLGYAD